MGMSIDEAITWLNTDDYESKGFAEATSVAIETMRKYQKIEQIYQKWNEVNDFAYNQAMREIGEVVEDGDNT